MAGGSDGSVPVAGAVDGGGGDTCTVPVAGTVDGGGGDACTVPVAGTVDGGGGAGEEACGLGVGMPGRAARGGGTIVQTMNKRYRKNRRVLESIAIFFNGTHLIFSIHKLIKAPPPLIFFLELSCFKSGSEHVADADKKVLLFRRECIFLFC